MDLPHPNNLHLLASQGWLELGNVVEALNELKGIQPGFKKNPEVLKMHWEISAAAKKWDSCVQIAKGFSRLYADDWFGYIRHSFALHELKRTKEAKDVLEEVLDDFSDEYLFSYNLACYCAQLGELPEAEVYLGTAIELGGDEIKSMAMEDSDLEPIWSKGLLA